MARTSRAICACFACRVTVDGRLNRRTVAATGCGLMGRLTSQTVLALCNDNDWHKMSTISWSSNIVGESDVDPQALQANPLNHRRHSKRQIAALKRVMADIGWVQRVVVNRRSGKIVDGHARVALAIREKQPTVPVIYVDLDEQSERAALASYDAIGALAGVDTQAWAQHVKSLPDMSALLTSVRPSTFDTNAVPKLRLYPLSSHVGAYALHGRAQVDLPRFDQWKNAGDSQMQASIVDSFVEAWSARFNHVDAVTMPPPSLARGRTYDNHSMWPVVQAVAEQLQVPAVKLWQPRQQFTLRGRGRASTTLAALEWVDDVVQDIGSVLVLDDTVTTRATHSQVRSALFERKIAVFFLAYLSYGH